MTGEIWRKIKAILLIAIIAGAEVSHVQQEARVRTSRQFRLRSSSTQGTQAKSDAEQTSDDMVDNLVNKLFDKSFEGATQSSSDHLDFVGKLVSKLFSEAMREAPSYKMSDAQNSTDDLLGNLVDKLFSGAIKAPGLHQEHLDHKEQGTEQVSEAQTSMDDLVDKLVHGSVDKLFSTPIQGKVANPKTRLGFGGFEGRHSLQKNAFGMGKFAPRVSSPSLVPQRPLLNVKGPVTVHASDASGPLAKWKEQLPSRIELKKMLPLASMFFCILFVYTILRDTKDVLVVTSGGAEVIPFLKTYMNLPAAIGFTAVYAILVNRMSNVQIFYTLLTTFATFFALFAAVIFPNRDLVHPVAWATNLAAQLPPGFGPPLAIIKYWTFGAFYTMAELWGSVVVSLLFWGFANDVCSVSEGKRWYPLFGLIANVALIFSGQFIRKVSDLRGHLPEGVDPWGYTLNILSIAVVVGASLVMGIYTYMQKTVMTDPDCVPAAADKKKKKSKPSMGIGESFKYLLSSSYIRNLAFLVIAYGTSINIVEVSWKGKLKEQYPNPNDYSSFMGAFSSTTGCITLAMMLIGRWILNRFGWGVGALVTPTMLGVTGITFFSLILFKESFAPLTAMLGLTPLMMAVLVGAAQNILSKSSKYSLFDPCKETAYIPLDAEMRTKGKAAIDVIGNPLGKSSGAFIQQAALFSCGSLAASTPFLGGVLVVMVGLWITAARALAVEFEEVSGRMMKTNTTAT